MAAVEQGGAHATPPLGDRELRMLEFERLWHRHDGRKEEAIRAEFELSPARYYQVLNRVIDSPAAVRHDPMLVGQLQRARLARTAARAARSFTTAPPSGGHEQRSAEELND